MANETKFTPGPWTVHAEREAGIGRTTALFICGAEAWPEGQLARVNTQDGLHETVANARLIATAPSMFAFVETICGFTQPNGNYSDDADTVRSLIVAAKKLRAKATTP